MKKRLSILCILLFILICIITVYASRNSGAETSDFTRTAYQENTYQMEHEFQVIGLIPDITNTITFTLTSEDGLTSTYTTSYDMPSLYGEEKVKLDTKTLSTSEQLSDGY